MTATINPNPPPDWVKDTVAEPMAKLAREQGRIPNADAIDREAQRMIERYDAQERENPDAHKSLPVQPRVRDVAAEEAAKIGATFKRGEPIKPQLPPRRVTRLTPWQAALTARIQKICSLVPGAQYGFRKRLFRYPRLAEEYLTEFMMYKTRRRHYALMTDRDAERQLSRFTEDLADRSVPVLGAWRIGGV